MLQMGLHLRADGTVDTSAFKIVYVAPMKALVAEMVGNFSERLKEYNMQARAWPESAAACEDVSNIRLQRGQDVHDPLGRPVLVLAGVGLVKAVKA